MPPYSTLEVVGVERYYPYNSGETEKEVIQYDTVYPQLAPFETDRGYLPEVVASGRVEQFPSNPPPAQEPPPQQQPPTRIWGLPNRTFYVVLVIGIIIIVGALAGGLGGGLSAKHSDSSSNGSQDNPGGNIINNNNNFNVLAASQLTASNRTDLNGNVHRTVFFQDPSSALIARRWDSVNQTWTTANLTALLSSFATSSTPLDIALAPGASLASASLTYGNKSETHVWFVVSGTATTSSTTSTSSSSVNFTDDTSDVSLTSSSSSSSSTTSDGGGAGTASVRSLVLMNPDAQPDVWQLDDFDGATLNAYPGSRLAAAWQRCWKPDTTGRCLGAWALAYQDTQGNVRVGNGTDWTTPELSIAQADVARASSLALVAQVEVGGEAVSRLILVAEGQGGEMVKTTYQDGWSAAKNSLMDGLPAPSPTLQFAMTVQNNFAETDTIALLPNGTVTALLWDGHFSDVPAVSFSGGPDDVNFTAIAVSEDAMIYGVSNDEILQYEPDPGNAYTYSYVGRVYP